MLLDRLDWGRIAAMQVCRLWTWHSFAKIRKKGRRWLCPWPLRCLSQFLSERKERLLRLGVPFTDGVDMYL